MSGVRRGLVLCALAAGVVAHPALARAEDADSLPTLDESSPVSEPAAPPVPPVIEPTLVQTPRRLDTPKRERTIREERRLALLGELGWNGLAGFGPVLVFHVHPHVSFDLGAGLSLSGWKTGLRGRYNFTTRTVTPFIGAGIVGAAGWGDNPIPINNTNDDSSNANNFTIKVRPSAFVQAVAGVDWTSKGGFTLLGTGGYAFLISRDPVEITSGTPTTDQQRGLDVAFRSGVIASIALGYSFR